jgi:hypothetical protein
MQEQQQERLYTGTATMNASASYYGSIYYGLTG